jgi:hypothetical protein
VPIPTITIGGQIADNGMDTGQRVSIIRLALAPTILPVLRLTGYGMQLRLTRPEATTDKAYSPSSVTRARALSTFFVGHIQRLLLAAMVFLAQQALRLF